MATKTLFKYLDAQGGLKMLHYGNLQFTNATRFNDPFDCHPSLIDFSRVPAEKMEVWDKETVMALESNYYENLRHKAWICSLSKVHDSLLMWSYYTNHRGVCIGINMEKARTYLSKIYCSVFIGALEMEVQYKDIIEKPDYFRDRQDFFRYQLSTKAKAWEHEQEVRLLLIDPSPAFVHMALPYQPKNENEDTDWEELRAYPKIGGECFESLYLGINVEKDKREKLIEVARQKNPEIKIYQMTIDPDAFRLKEEIIES